MATPRQFTLVDDFVLKTPTFCVHSNVLNIINRVVVNDHGTYKDQFKEVRILPCICALGEYFYYRGTIPFTYVHIDDKGILLQVSKAYFRKQILKKFSTVLPDGTSRLTRRDEMVQEKWDYHGNFAEDKVEEEARPVKWGTLMKALCPNIDEKTLSLLCDKLADKTKELMDLNYSVQVHDKPSEIYTLESMFSSCMTGQDKEKFLIYDDLPSTSIAYIVDENNVLQARALLHDALYKRQPIKIMDRIYFRDSYCLAAMKRWALDHGYWHKTQQSLDWNTFTNKEGEVKSFRALRLPAADLADRYIALPYIDTFCKLGYDAQGRLHLGAKGSRQNPHIAVLQHYSRSVIPTILLDKKARRCPECDKLTRAANLRWRLGYNTQLHVDEKSFLCSTCASKLELCPVCKKHYIYTDAKWHNHKAFLGVQIKNIDTNYWICWSCHNYFKEVQKDRVRMVEEGKLPLQFLNVPIPELTHNIEDEYEND